MSKSNSGPTGSAVENKGSMVLGISLHPPSTRDGNALQKIFQKVENPKKRSIKCDGGKNQKISTALHKDDEVFFAFLQFFALLTIEHLK
jgi:hypothetical protein